MSASYVTLVAALLILFVCLRLILAGTRKPALAPTSPCCARCRYPTAGLDTLRCPECGSDLRVTGIVTLAMAVRLMPGLTSALLGWTTLAGLVSYFIIFATYRTNVRFTTGAPTSEPDLTLTPASGSCDHIDLFRDYGGDVFPVRLVLHTRDHAEHTLRMRHTGYGVNIADASGASTSIEGRVKTDHLAPWYAAAGIDTQLPPNRAELDELTLLINAELSPEGDPWPTLSTFASKTPTPPAVTRVGLGPVYTTAGVCGAVYLAGVLFIAHRRHRLLVLANRVEQAELNVPAESPAATSPAEPSAPAINTEHA